MTVIHKCKDCQETKPIKDRLAKEYLWQCDDCHKAWAFEYRKKRKVEGRPIISNGVDKEYWKNAYHTTDRGFKNRVRSKLKRAVKNGTIKKLPCKVCGDVNSEAHHEDYNKPLDVVWFCRAHHRQYHSSQKEFL